MQGEMWEKERTRKGGDRERTEEDNTREQKTERQEQKITKNRGKEGNDHKSFTVGGVGAGADGPAGDGAGRVAEF